MEGYWLIPPLIEVAFLLMLIGLLVYCDPLKSIMALIHVNAAKRFTMKANLFIFIYLNILHKYIMFCLHYMR